MNDRTGYLETKIKTYPICFNLNVLEDIQDKYGSITAWGDAVSDKEKDGMNIKELKAGLMLMINEAIDKENDDLSKEEKKEFINDRQVGRIISEIGIDKVKDIILDLVKKSNDTEDEQKNM